MTHVSKRGRPPGALACQPPSLRPYDLKEPQLSTCISPTPTAQGDRCCRERGIAHGDTAEPLRASAPAPYRDQTQRRPQDLRAPEALSPQRPVSEPVCVCEGKVALGRSVRSGGMSTSLSICSIIIFYCFTEGKTVGVGWCTHGISSSTIIPLTTGPDPASPSTSIPILSVPDFESGSASIASASASPNRPSSMNGVPNAFTICVWPVVSSPGATCPPLPGIVDGRCAARPRPGSVENRDFVTHHQAVGLPCFEY